MRSPTVPDCSPQRKVHVPCFSLGACLLIRRVPGSRPPRELKFPQSLLYSLLGCGIRASIVTRSSGIVPSMLRKTLPVVIVLTARRRDTGGGDDARSSRHAPLGPTRLHISRRPQGFSLGWGVEGGSPMLTKGRVRLHGLF